jgi:hypothetical protein
VIFIRFRGPQAQKDRVESRVPAAENKPVTARAFIHFRGPKALLDIIKGAPLEYVSSAFLLKPLQKRAPFYDQR